MEKKHLINRFAKDALKNPSKWKFIKDGKEKSVENLLAKEKKFLKGLASARVIKRTEKPKERELIRVVLVKQVIQALLSGEKMEVIQGKHRIELCPLIKPATKEEFSSDSQDSSTSSQGDEDITVIGKTP